MVLPQNRSLGLKDECLKAGDALGPLYCSTGGLGNGFFKKRMGQKPRVTKHLVSSKFWLGREPTGTASPWFGEVKSGWKEGDLVIDGRRGVSPRMEGGTGVGRNGKEVFSSLLKETRMDS